MRVRDINGCKKKTRIMAANSAGGWREGTRIIHTRKYLKNGDSSEEQKTNTKGNILVKKQ
jgi:hypothetical protein